MGEDQNRDARLENKQQFLRLLNIVNQIFMCVYDQDKVSVDSSSAEECLKTIKDFIESEV